MLVNFFFFLTTGKCTDEGMLFNVIMKQIAAT